MVHVQRLTLGEMYCIRDVPCASASTRGIIPLTLAIPREFVSDSEALLHPIYNTLTHQYHPPERLTA